MPIYILTLYTYLYTCLPRVGIIYEVNIRKGLERPKYGARGSIWLLHLVIAFGSRVA